MKRLIAPSILSADFSKLGEEVAAVERGGADWIHIDVMDGHFVPNISVGMPVVKSLKAITSKPLDVHLMIQAPEKYICDFAKAGADILSIHPEATPHSHRALSMIRDCGCKAGMVLNPSTPLSVLDHLWDQLDMVLLMSVNPGFGGQSFIPETCNKVSMLKTLISEKGKNILIEVDGGINASNVSELGSAGADVFVAGSAIFGSDNYAQAIQNLRC